MAYTIPTLDDLHAFLIALFAYLFPDKDVSQGSFNWLWLRTLAAGAAANDAHIFADTADLMPDTSTGTMQDRWAKLVGRPRKSATASRGTKALRVFGTAGTPVDEGETLTSAAGFTYQITMGDIVGAGGYVDVDVASVDLGAATALSTGATLSFTATPVGLEEQAELQIDLTAGTDQETEGALSLRIVDRFKNPPLGGAANDYVTWALAVADVGAAFCYPLRAGYGTVDIVALHPGSGSDRILTAPEVANVQAAIDAVRPVSVKDARVLTVTANAVDVDYTIVTDGALENKFDWDDTTPGTVLAYTAATRTLQFTGGARPATMLAGHRISIKPAAGGGSGVQRVIESLSGADSVVLEQQTGADDPAAGDTIYAGGPLVEPVRQAVIGLFNGLGTANPDGARYGAWEGNIRPSAIGRVATAVAGVIDGTTVAPAATVQAADPAFPNDSTIELLVPGRVLVRAQH